MLIDSQIRKVIELDHQAETIIAEAKQEAEQITSETAERIRQRRNTVLEQAKSTGKTNYKTEIEIAEKIKTDTIREMSEELEQFRAVFDQHKAQWADCVLSEITGCVIKNVR